MEVELLSFAVSAKELLLRRYKTLTGTLPPPPIRAGVFTALAIVLTGLCHLAFFSAADVTGLENPYVQFANPYLADVVGEYCSMEDPADLTMRDLADIYCLEFGISDLIHAENRSEFPFAEGKYPLSCTINEGKLLCDGVYLDAVVPGARTFTKLCTDHRYMYTIDLVPAICRRDALTKYLPAGRAEQEAYLAQYALVDATEEALTRYSSAEYMKIIANHNLKPDDDELQIRDIFETYFRENDISVDSYDETYSGRLKEWYRNRITAVAPCAVHTPLIFLDENISEEAMYALIHWSYESGALAYRLAESKSIATEDLALFTGLRTVIFADGLQPADPEVYTNTRYAVIVRSWWS